MKVSLYLFVIHLYIFFFICCNQIAPIYANQDTPNYSYLKKNNGLISDTVKSYCFVASDDDSIYQQIHEIVYTNAPDAKIRPDFLSIKKNKAIIFKIRFQKLDDEKIVGKKITLPEKRFEFYSNVTCKDRKEQINYNNSLIKLDVLSGSIEFESLREKAGSNNRTIGSFIIHLNNNEVIEGSFNVRAKIREVICCGG